MNTPKSPGAVVALGASVVDQLGRQVIPEINRRQQLPQAAIRTAGAGDRAVMAASNGGAQRRPAFVAGAQAGARTPEQRSADLIAARKICRRAPAAMAGRDDRAAAGQHDRDRGREFWADARRAQEGRVRPPDEPRELQNFVRRHRRQRRASHLGRQNRRR